MLKILALAAASALSSGYELPQELTCTAAQTAGFHDYPLNAAGYESVVFHESVFDLVVNQALSLNLAGAGSSDLYLTLTNDEILTELSCVYVRGIGDVPGLSCSNTPPAQMLLINLRSLRFTRTAIGGWTFDAKPAEGAGDSIYVEYGQCVAD